MFDNFQILTTKLRIFAEFWLIIIFFFGFFSNKKYRFYFALHMICCNFATVTKIAEIVY